MTVDHLTGAASGRAAMDEVMARADRSLHALRDAQELITALRIQATAAAGAVTATVDGRAAPVGLTLTAAATRLAPSELGSAIVTAFADAAAQVADHQHRIIGDLQRQLADPPP